MVLIFRNVNHEDWSSTWKRSKQPRKQRKYVINAPKHVRRRLIVSPISKELRELLGIRNLSVAIGDYVKIERGKFRGKEGHVTYIDTKHYRVYIDIAYIEKKNGEKSYYPIHASKLTILKLNLTDKNRLKIIRRKNPNISDKQIEELLKRSITDKAFNTSNQFKH
ncbi:MAG TPA: 50S ribosomal protein L24 [Candidatus Nanopusillus sp.]|nr:50S ribosomal protein L24 [Candidatus Nanopusillus sp.]HIP90402.1 50S ribosomal protein L24 [Candidatus Nanopusillus sp.]